LSVGVEVGGRHAQTRLVQRQAERGRRVIKMAVSVVDQQRVAQPLWADNGGGQVDVQLAVAVRIERGSCRAEAGAPPANYRVVSAEVVRRGPSVAGLKPDIYRPRGLEPRWDWGSLPCRDGTDGRVYQRRILTHLAVGLRRGVAGTGHG